MAQIKQQAENGNYVLLGEDGNRLALPGGAVIPEFRTEAAAKQWVADLGITPAPTLTPDEHRQVKELLAGTHPTQTTKVVGPPIVAETPPLTTPGTHRDFLGVEVPNNPAEVPVPPTAPTEQVVEVPAATLPVTNKK